MANRVCYSPGFAFLPKLHTLPLSFFSLFFLPPRLLSLLSTCPRPLIFLSSHHPLLSSHLSLLYHITHPVRTSHPISPSLTPNLSLLLSSLHPVTPAALSPSPSSIFLPFWLSSPFLFHPFSSLPHHFFTACLVSRQAKVSVTHIHTHISFDCVLPSISFNLYFSFSPSSVILWRKGK